MKRYIFIAVLIVICLSGCGKKEETTTIENTPEPVIATETPSVFQEETPTEWESVATPEPTEAPDLLDIINNGSNTSEVSDKYTSPEQWNGWSKIVSFDNTISGPFTSMPGDTTEASISQDIEDFTTPLAIINTCIQELNLSTNESLYKDSYLSKSPIILAYANQYVFSYNGYVLYTAYTDDTLYIWTDNAAVK